VGSLCGRGGDDIHDDLVPISNGPRCPNRDALHERLQPLLRFMLQSGLVRFAGQAVVFDVICLVLVTSSDVIVGTLQSSTSNQARSTLGSSINAVPTYAFANSDVLLKPGRARAPAFELSPLTHHTCSSLRARCRRPPSSLRRQLCGIQLRSAARHRRIALMSSVQHGARSPRPGPQPRCCAPCSRSARSSRPLRRPASLDRVYSCARRPGSCRATSTTRTRRRSHCSNSSASASPRTRPARTASACRSLSCPRRVSSTRRTSGRHACRASKHPLSGNRRPDDKPAQSERRESHQLAERGLLAGEHHRAPVR
jgi:hypothetical protein